MILSWKFKAKKLQFVYRRLNEEMIETLFKANGPSKDGPRRSIIPSMDEEYRILDPKKSQNIAILLKALNVTEQEVCEALLEGI